MADNRYELLAEGYRRGILPPDMKAAFEEAQKRGLFVASDMQAAQQPDYGKMSAGEVAMSALKSTPQSAVNLATDIAQPIIHPIETATNIGNIGKGVLQKLGIMGGKDAEPYADAVGKFLVDRYGSGEAIKKTIATDPVGMAADIATVLSGGELAAARAPGVVGKAGQVAGAVGRAVDPLSAVGAAVKGVGKAVTEPLGLTTGQGGEAIRLAAEAGAKGGEAGRAFREPEGIIQDAKAAVGKLRQERGDLYRKDMAKIGADTTVLDFADIDKAVTNTVKTFKGRSISPSTAKIQGDIAKTVEEWKALDPADFHTPEGLDALKQEIGDIRDNTQFGTPQRVAADKVYNAVKDTIVKQAPEYGKVMKGYEEASAQIREIESTLSLNPKANVDTQLRKLLSSLRDNVNTNYGRRKELVAFLARAGAPNLLYKLAGKSLSSYSPRGLARPLAGAEGASALGALAMGQPAAAAALGAGVAMSSPALIGGAAYGSGAVTRLPLRKLGQSSRLLGAAGQ